MKYSLLLFLVLFSKCLLAQNLKLNNAIIIAQFEKEEDRYAMQAMLSELFKANQVKVLPVMNVLKQGEDIQHLLNDSIQALVRQKGFDTYLVVNVRGYDRKFKVSEDTQTLAEMLETTSIYHIYRDEVTEPTFTRFGSDEPFLIFECSMICTAAGGVLRTKSKDLSP